MRYYLLRLLGFVFRLLPLNTAYWLGLRALDVAYRRNKRVRILVRRHHAIILSYQGIRPSFRTLDGLTRKTFQYFGKYLADFFRFRRMTPEEVGRTISVQGLEHFEQIAKSGRGGILLTAHIGNWELGGACIASMGYPISVVAKPVTSPTLERLFDYQRRQRGMQVIPWKSAGIGTYKTLRAGGLVAMLADRDFTGTGVTCKFMGRETQLPRGPAWLACRANVPICMGFLTREDDDSFLLRFLPVLDPADGLDEDALQKRIVDALEKVIIRDPCQWFNFSPCWSGDEKFVDSGTKMVHTTAHPVAKGG